MKLSNLQLLPGKGLLSPSGNCLRQSNRSKELLIPFTNERLLAEGCGSSSISWVLRSLVCLFACTFGINGWGAETSKHDEAVAFLKSFFASPPIVTNCVVERILFDKDGSETSRNYYQFRHQPGAYVIRQIPSPTPPETLTLPPMGIISGSVEGSTWYYHQGTLVHLPSVSAPKQRTRGHGPAYIAASTMHNALSWGINETLLDTIVWQSEGKFSGDTKNGGKIEGQILSSTGFKPTMIASRYNGESLHMFVEYKYDKHLSEDYPSELHFSIGSARGPSFKEVLYKIHSYETNAFQLDNSHFQLSAYYKPTGYSVPEIIYTNEVAHRYDGGRLVPSEGLPKSQRVSFVRIIYFILILFLSIGLFWIWKRKKVNSQ